MQVPAKLNRQAFHRNVQSSAAAAAGSDRLIHGTRRTPRTHRTSATGGAAAQITPTFFFFFSGALGRQGEAGHHHLLGYDQPMARTASSRTCPVETPAWMFFLRETK